MTGGAGFLGKAIIRELLDPDSPVKAATIRIFDLVIHSAAIVDWGIKSDEEVLAVNFTGT